MSENKKTRLKFLHCSDIHLDTPFVGLTAEKNEERRRMLRGSFVKMMQYVREAGINIVLMSGDLFDVEYATNTTAEVLIREFKSCPDTYFVIATTRTKIISSGIAIFQSNIKIVAARHATPFPP